MRKFITLSICLLLSFLSEVEACGPTIDPYYSDVFHIYNKAPSDTKQKQLSAYWASYVGKLNTEQTNAARSYPYLSDYFFANDCELLMQVAKKKNDKEMLTYLEQTRIYNKMCGDIRETWTYPTEEQLVARKKALTKMQDIGKNYQGKRLKAQYALLYMRANLLLKNYAHNEQYWDKVAKHLPEGVLKDMMEAIYANAILQKGRWREACDIYVRQDDWESVEWAMQNYRNAIGIQKVYQEDPNSPALNYLVQHYINGGYAWEWDEDVFRTHTKKEIEQFKTFIEKDVLKNEQVSDKALWMAALAMLYYNDGNVKQAEKNIKKAIALPGSERTKESVRCIALLISTKTQKYGSSYAKYLCKEVDWLLSKQAVKGADTYYFDMLCRMIYRELTPRMLKAGKKNEALTLLAMMEDVMETYDSSDETNTYAQGVIASTWEYKLQLDSLTAKELVQFSHYLQAKPKDKLQELAISKIQFEPYKFNEMIGTKYMAEGDFAAAITYLEHLPIKYIKLQPISFYASKRKFDKDRWFERQPIDDEYYYNNVSPIANVENVKLAFCRDMLNLASQYRLASTPDVAAEKAYTLASRYFQASCYGDCWYLTHYQKSSTDSARAWEKDFVQEALRWLNVSKEGSKRDVQLRSLFAIAFIEYNVGSTINYYYAYYDDQPTWFGKMSKGSKLYNAYNHLATFVKNNNIKQRYITRCDILREFMEKW